jgi:Ca2+-binding EF-hand superfamily protein
METLFRFFDRNSDGKLSFDELILALRVCAAFQYRCSLE